MYDLSTIKECLRICEHWDKRVKDLKDDEVSSKRENRELLWKWRYKMIFGLEKPVKT